MWIFAKQGFISVVVDRNNINNCIVRARFIGHIKAIFPKARVKETPEADYRFRATIKKEEVSRVVSEAVNNIDYTNFKNSLEEAKYHRACSTVWHDMYRIQDETYGR